ncbi:DAD family-domain-containing protein [Aspergillus recurvatus]
MPSKRPSATPSSSSAPADSASASASTSGTSTPLATLSSGPKTLSANSSISDIAVHVWHQYLTTTPQRTMLLDAFMAFLVLVGGVQFAYCVLAGNYPFNAFLSGFCAAVGQFVLTASLRMQTSSVERGSGSSKGKGSGGKVVEPGDGVDGGVSHERAFADYVFGSLILHFFCINFIN